MDWPAVPFGRLMPRDEGRPVEVYACPVCGALVPAPKIVAHDSHHRRAARGDRT